MTLRRARLEGALGGQMNARLVGVLKGGRLVDTHWYDVHVGDFVRVRRMPTKLPG